MKILIPSRGRPHTQITAPILKRAGVDFTIVRTTRDDTVYPSEYDQVFFDVEGICEKRNAILDAFPGKLFVIDDDITFLRTQEDGTTSVCTNEQIRDMIAKMERYLDHVAHAGVSPRFMINTKPLPYQMNTKPKSVLGYNTNLFPDPPPRFRMKACSDIDFNMQLLSCRRSVVMMTEYCYQEGKYMADGGCSIWRTRDDIKAGHDKLVEYWPRYIKLKEGDDVTGGVLATIYIKKMSKDYDCLPRDIRDCYEAGHLCGLSGCEKPIFHEGECR